MEGADGEAERGQSKRATSEVRGGRGPMSLYQTPSPFRQLKLLKAFVRTYGHKVAGAFTSTTSLADTIVELKERQTS
jgi:hypothetical protein